MRNRFFFIILTALTLAAVGINLVHVEFFKNQRLKLIDRQINESSLALLKSKEFRRAVRHWEDVDEVITKVLKGVRIGKVFILRDRNSAILYQSFNVGHLNVELPITPEWVALETEDEYVRLRNIQVPGTAGRILQVGLVLDRNFLHWEIIDNRLLNYIAGIVLTLFLASVVVTLILLAPIRLLNAHLNQATSSMKNLSDVDPLPMRLRNLSNGFWSRSDEFSSLLNTVQKLIDRINLNYKLTRSWTLQMAHELKTPLAIMRAETASTKKTGQLPENFADGIIKEVDHMSGIINQFLDWAELESSLPGKDLHALKIKNALRTAIVRLEKISSGRIRLAAEADFQVFANPNHLDQLITNVLTNALKFSPEDTGVDVTVIDHTLTIKDRGPGIPSEVKERIGQPFNVGTFEDGRQTGNGLGLAWVSTVAKLYRWELIIHSDHTGTQIKVIFPTA